MKKASNTTGNTLFLTQAAVIAALYLALFLPFQPIAFGPIQFRISEMLCVMPFFTAAGIPGVTIGCLLANFIGGAPLPDIIFGTLATLIGAAGTWWIGKQALPHGKQLALLPPILSNALIIPFVLKYAYGAAELVPFMMLTVGIGEILAVGVLGSVLMGVLEKYGTLLFRPRQVM